ncbi:MAG: nucleotidyltransferase family protein [Pseudomonadota bacterium]
MRPPSAMIFAAGFGTRMGTLTENTPKPMLPFKGRPLIDHSIEILRDAGVEKIVANTHYLPETLEAHLHRENVITHREVAILETGGGLKAALPLLGDGPVITINPDVLWTGRNPAKALMEAWRPDMKALLMLYQTEQSECDFSLYNGKISRKGPFRYTGLQMIQPEGLLDFGTPVFSLNRVWDRISSQGNLNGIVHDGGWIDVGTEADLMAARSRVGK